MSTIKTILKSHTFVFMTRLMNLECHLICVSVHPSFTPCCETCLSEESILYVVYPTIFSLKEMRGTSQTNRLQAIW